MYTMYMVHVTPKCQLDQLCKVRHVLEGPGKSVICFCIVEHFHSLWQWIFITSYGQSNALWIANSVVMSQQKFWTRCLTRSFRRMVIITWQWMFVSHGLGVLQKSSLHRVARQPLTNVFFLVVNVQRPSAAYRFCFDGCKSLKSTCSLLLLHVFMDAKRSHTTV